MIRQNWLAIVFGIGILMVMGAAAYLKSEADKGDGHPSSHSNLSHGAKAAYLLLQPSGYPMERWERSPKELPADGHGVLLIVAGPVSYPSAELPGRRSFPLTLRSESRQPLAPCGRSV